MIWLLGLLLILATGAHAATLGVTTPGPSVDSGNAQTLNAARVTSPEAGTATALSVYVATLGPAPRVRLGLYAVATGALLETTAEFTPVVGWNTAALLTAVPLTSGATYWLVYWPNGVGGADNAWTYGPGAVDQYQWMPRSFALAWPAGFAPTGSSADAPAIYATYTPTGGAPPDWPVPGVAATFVREASLTLSWQDNATNEDGVRVERRLTPNPFVQIADIGLPNIVTFTDGTVVTGLSYCYRVLAYNAAGASGYSNEACGTSP